MAEVGGKDATKEFAICTMAPLAARDSNIGFARNERGHRVRLPFIRFIRIEVLEGKAEIDAFSATARNLRRRR
jgi:hypothetical protein